MTSLSAIPDPDQDQPPPFRTADHLSAETLWWGLLILAFLLVGMALVLMLFGRTNFSASTDLHTAVMSRPQDIVPLIQAGADPNARDASGETPLMLALRFGNPQVVRLLLEHGADPDLVDPLGKSALLSPYLSYVQHPHVGLILLLLEHGADPNLADHGGVGPLHRACGDGSLQLAEELIRRGADVNALSDVGTPLHWAVMGGHYLIVELLLKAGADPRIPEPSSGVTPDLYASGSLKTLLEQALESYQAPSDADAASSPGRSEDPSQTEEHEATREIEESEASAEEPPAATCATSADRRTFVGERHAVS